MEGHNSNPPWLLEAIRSAVTTREYDDFSKGFADLMHQQISQNHLSSFAELNDAEKQPFIDATMSKLSNTPQSESLSDVLSSKIDESLHAWVGKQMTLDGINSEAQPTRTDLQLEGLYDAIVAIVRQFPLLKVRLRVLFNCDIPKKLRPPVWHAFLQNGKIRRQYMNRVATDPRRGLSVMDGEIAKKCDNLLAEHIAFSKFKGSTGALYAMRTAVSYFHNLVDAGNTLLAQSEFLLFCPFLYQVSSSIPRRQSPHPALITLLVEEYISFLESRPAYVCKPSLEDEQCKQFFVSVAKALHEINPELTKHIGNWPARDLPEGFPVSNGMSPALAALTQPLIRNMFVGFVNYNVLLFIWDQYILGIDVPSYINELLSICIALLLHLASSAIMSPQCQSVIEAIETIREHGLLINVQQIRYTLHQHFGKRLAELLPGGGTLKVKEFAGQPPILLLPPGYDGRTADRIKERQMVEHARMKHTAEEKRKEEEMKTRLNELESTLQRRLAEGEQRFASARQQYEDQLKVERERRAQVEEKAVREAASLRTEVESMRQNRNLVMGPSVVGQLQPNVSVRLPTVSADPQATPEVQQLINQYLGRVLDGYEVDNTVGVHKGGEPISKKSDPRYEDPLQNLDPQSKSILAGVLGAAGPGTSRLAHGGTGSKLTSPGYTLVNPSLDNDGHLFVQRLQAAIASAENHLFGRMLDSSALADMSEPDRQMAVSRILAHVASTSPN